MLFFLDAGSAFWKTKKKTGLPTKSQNLEKKEKDAQLYNFC